MTKQAKPIAVSDLSLDANNPRLPSVKLGMSQEDLVSHYFFHAGIQELVDSMLQNGFFQHEALIAKEDKQDGKHTVWEGNRRLAALKIIHRLDCSDDIPDPLLGKPIPESLREVPVVLVDDYAEVRTYIGFRHISGLKTWPPEAKARFVTTAVELAKENGDKNPFKTVGKEIGSNATGVKSYYLAHKTLEQAEEAGANSAELRSNRFAVWQRLWNNSSFRDYLNFPEVTSFTELNNQILLLNGNMLSETVDDLSVDTKTGRPLVPDSRDLDRYGKVLCNEKARTVLRETQDLAVASELVESALLTVRFDKVLRRLEILKDEVEQAETDDLKGADLKRSAKSLRAAAMTIHSLIDEAN